MPRHDWICEDCDAVAENIIHRLGHVPGQIGCSCGGNMHIHFGRIRVNGHWDDQRHNKMYGKEYHNGFGCVVESYEHKQQLLKEHDVSEAADPVGGSRSWRDQTPDNRQTASPDVSGAIEMTEEEYTEFKKQNG